jgi:hypothetical protein
MKGIVEIVEIDELLHKLQIVDFVVKNTHFTVMMRKQGERHGCIF